MINYEIIKDQLIINELKINYFILTNVFNLIYSSKTATKIPNWICIIIINNKKIYSFYLYTTSPLLIACIVVLIMLN